MKIMYYWICITTTTTIITPFSNSDSKSSTYKLKVVPSSLPGGTFGSQRWIKVRSNSSVKLGCPHIYAASPNVQMCLPLEKELMTSSLLSFGRCRKPPKYIRLPQWLPHSLNRGLFLKPGFMCWLWCVNSRSLKFRELPNYTG